MLLSISSLNIFVYFMVIQMEITCSPIYTEIEDNDCLNNSELCDNLKENEISSENKNYYQFAKSQQILKDVNETMKLFVLQVDEILGKFKYQVEKILDTFPDEDLELIENGDLELIDQLGNDQDDQLEDDQLDQLENINEENTNVENETDEPDCDSENCEDFKEVQSGDEEPVDVEFYTDNDK